jgi:gamma-glutamyltranspeptidase / glutathione hydrolase
MRSRSGMVSAGHPLASMAGLKVLAAGGNAVDAVLCAAAVTWVTMPMMCGPGGDAYVVLFRSATADPTAVGAGGRAPEGATADYFLTRGMKQVPLSGPHSVGVPGAMAVIDEVARRFGTMGLQELWLPAISLAEQGFPVSRKLANRFSEGSGRIEADPESAAIYLRSGSPPSEGTILVQRDLAKTIRQLAAGGAAEFYSGSIGEATTRHLRNHGGLMTMDDFGSHDLDVYTPLSINYRGFDIYQTAPPSQGLIHLETMNILEGFDLAGLPMDSDVLIHLTVEANKLAVADRLRHIGDPAVVDNPLGRLLSKTHAADQRKRIDPDRALPLAKGRSLPGDTTYICAVDGDGNAVSFIHSLSMQFGAGMTVPGTGIVLNNRVGRGFTLDAGHPNCIDSSKRTMSTLNCYIVTRNGRLQVIGGTPGGDGQVQWNSQILVSLLDGHLDPQPAVDRVRWTHTPSTDPATIDDPECLTIENRIPTKTVLGLERRGHDVRLIGSYAAGGDAQVIVVDQERGAIRGGSDSRGAGICLSL